MDGRKLAAILLLMAMMLSSLGLVYSAWTDTLLVEGTVNMGSLTLAFDYKEPPECHEYYLDEDGQLQKGEWEGKDVGSVSCRYEDLIEDPHTGKKGYKTLVIVVDNAYPQYIVHTTFLLHNIGTVPLSVYKYNITGEKRDSEGNLVYNLLWYDPNGDYIGSLWEDVNGNGVVDPGVDKEVINLRITNALPTQIDPCRTDKREIDMDFKQEAQECHTYIIRVTIMAVQWNKVDEVSP